MKTIINNVSTITAVLSFILIVIFILLPLFLMALDIHLSYDVYRICVRIMASSVLVFMVSMVTAVATLEDK